ncbi:response regulator transcription factor [Mariniluteicoccus endophyticus]
MKDIRIVVCDDHEVIRIGLREALGRKGFTVVGEAATGADAVEVVRLLRPDLALLDLQMPEQDGIAACASITSEWGTPVVILSAFKDADLEAAARSAGASAFLLKSMPLPALVNVLQYAVGTPSAPDQGHTPAARRADEEQPAARTESLTSREKEILGHLGEGLSNEEIAARLHISAATVKTHVSNILRKLGLTTRTQAALHARGR